MTDLGEQTVRRRPPRGRGTTRAARRAAEREAGRRKPLVFCSRFALEQAQLLLPGRCVENIVGERIAQGALSHEPRHGGEAVVYLDEHGLVAMVARTTSLTSGRKAWRVIGLRPAGRVENFKRRRSEWASQRH